MTADAMVPTESGRALTAAEFQGLADAPAAAEWFANLGNHATRRAYQNALHDFMRFVGISRPEEFRAVTRAHVIAWRDELQRGDLGATSIRHRLSALASLFDYLCEKNAVSHNPVKGMKRTAAGRYLCREDAGARRSPSQAGARGAGSWVAERPAGSGDPGDAALSRAASG